MGWFWIFPGRNGLISNPWLRVGDKAFKEVDGKLEPIVVINRHRNGTIDISFAKTGKVEKFLHRNDCKGIEWGRLARLMFFIIDAIFEVFFFVKRRVPLCTISRKKYLHTMYGRKSLYKNEVRNAFKELGIRRSEQMQWLEVWAKIDSDESNSMDMDEFCKFFGFEAGTEIVQRIFEMFDLDGSKQIKFVDFLHAAWDICTYDEDRSKKFWFRVLQKSGQRFQETSVIDLRDITRILRLFYGNKDIDMRAAMVDYVADDDASGGVSFEEFIDFSRGHLLLIYPGFWAQNKLRDGLFGRKYWSKRTDQKSKLYCRNKAMELRLKAFEQMPMAPGNKRKFEQDFHWEGKRPNVYHKKFQVVPVDEDEESLTSSAPVDEHIVHNGFY
jgi:Ca2+-binding EF-hand superfamily protein